jgi:hypothetical protein
MMMMAARVMMVARRKWARANTAAVQVRCEDT